ncbi:hypothetical protein [Nocardia stercoris]|nr:hypothetical protein [Nocardia stercoris]
MARTRLVLAVLVAFGGGAAWLLSTRRPQLPEPAAEPPRLGHSSRNR